MSGVTAAEVDTRSTGCCAGCSRFWGPFRPLLGGHSLAEVATSAYMPTTILCVLRAAFAIFLLTTVIYYLLTGDYTIIYYSVWCHIGLGVAFALICAISIIHLVQPPSNTYRDEPSSLATIAVITFQIFATAALFLDVVFWGLLFDGSVTFPNLIQHALNILFIVIEMLVALRMQFKLVYCALFIFYTIIYVGFAWIRFAVIAEFPYGFLDYRDQSNSTTVLFYVIILLWGILASTLLLLFSRLSRLPCLPPVPHRKLYTGSSNRHRNQAPNHRPVNGVSGDDSDSDDGALNSVRRLRDPGNANTNPGPSQV